MRQVPEVTAPVMDGCWWTPFGQFGETTVMHVDLRTRADREARAFDLLDEVEQARWSQFCYPGPGRRFALCRAALRAVLAQQLDCVPSKLTFVAGEYGKPTCILGNEPAPISFNVSHSGSHGLIAFASEGQVGVDVEERTPRKYLDELIGTVLSLDERLEVKELSRTDRFHFFLRLWTIKEAIIKAIGTGHSLDISRVETPKAMRRGNRAGIFQASALGRASLQVEDLSNDDFAAALAYELLP